MPSTNVSKPEFSIIIATYNRANYIPRTVGTILKQTFTNYELLIVDDGSTDATSEVVSKLNVPQLRYLRQASNQGVGAARNVGISQAQGKYIVFVDDDDGIAPEFLAEVHDLIKSLPATCGFMWTWKQTGTFVDEKWDGHQTHTYDIHDPKPRDRHSYYVSLPGGSGGLVVRADCLRMVGGFDEHFRAVGDTDLMIRLAAHYDYAVLPKPLYYISTAAGGQLTSPSISRAKANESLVDKHYALFQERPSLLTTSYRRIAKMYYAAGAQAHGRRIMRQLLHARPFSIKSYGLWLLLEVQEWLPLWLRTKLQPITR